MSEQPNKPPPRPHGIEWFWWGVLVVSLLVGFGLTIFAST
jgi:hypothetical protein